LLLLFLKVKLIDQLLSLYIQFLQHISYILDTSNNIYEEYYNNSAIDIDIQVLLTYKVEIHPSIWDML
jgi:hypothetical protein